MFGVTSVSILVKIQTEEAGVGMVDGSPLGFTVEKDATSSACPESHESSFTLLG